MLGTVSSLIFQNVPDKPGITGLNWRQVFIVYQRQPKTYALFCLDIDLCWEVLACPLSSCVPRLCFAVNLLGVFRVPHFDASDSTNVRPKVVDRTA